MFAKFHQANAGRVAQQLRNQYLRRRFSASSFVELVHHFAIQRHVEDFLAVLVPSRLCAAARGNLKLSARPRKWLGVDLKPPGFIRLVCDPFAVGGELALAFLRRGFQESERLLIAGDGKEPQVAARLRTGAAEQQEESIWGKTVCHLGLIRFKQQFTGSSTVR